MASSNRMHRGVSVALIALACGWSAAACTDHMGGVPGVVGPESLTVMVTVRPDTVVVGQSVALHVAVKNASSAIVLARYQYPACGLEVVIETRSDTSVSSFPLGICRPQLVNGQHDVIAPGDSAVVDYVTSIPERGTYRVRATFEAENGRAPASVAVPFVIR